jgi:hypothetical protein
LKSQEVNSSTCQCAHINCYNPILIKSQDLHVSILTDLEFFLSIYLDSGGVREWEKPTHP